MNIIGLFLMYYTKFKFLTIKSCTQLTEQQYCTSYPRLEDNFACRIPYGGRRRTYSILRWIIYRVISSSLALAQFICWSPLGQPNVPPAHDLPSPRWLSMHQVIRCVIKSRDVMEFHWIQTPNDKGFPL